MACTICCASKKTTWRSSSSNVCGGGNDRTLVIIDQFEELFTLSPVDVQASFARMLGRLVVEADVRVIVSLRDDFLIHCQAHDALLPAFADVTPLGLLGVSSMRRALVQPALACGYRFEDEALVDEMIRDVSRERGALPLLAFAASRLWEKRDRERGLLTREAYKEIGGVGGALAQHAEVTLERIGRKRIPLVRELFRNLVTSQGTRAVRERDELLSVFDGKSDTIGTRAEAEDVVNALVDARLLNVVCPGGPVWRQPATARNRSRVPAVRLAAAGPVACAGSRRRADSRPVEACGAALARAWTLGGSPVVRDDLSRFRRLAGTVPRAAVRKRIRVRSRV